VNSQEGLPGKEGLSEEPSDTTILEEVLISVLPFQEKYLEATGAVYTISVLTWMIYQLSPETGSVRCRTRRR